MEKETGFPSFGICLLQSMLTQIVAFFSVIFESSSVYFSVDVSAGLHVGKTRSDYDISQCDSSYRNTNLSRDRNTRWKIFLEYVFSISAVISLLGLLAVLLII